MGLKELFNKHIELLDYLKDEDWETFSDSIDDLLAEGELTFDETKELTYKLYEADFLNDILIALKHFPYWSDFHLFTYYEIPEGVLQVDENAFFSCEELKSVILPNSINMINDNAFYGCTSLESVNIPDGTTYIGTAAFAFCNKLESIKIPKSVTVLRPCIFDGCEKLKDIYFDMDRDTLLKRCNYRDYRDRLDISILTNIHFSK